jgi:hypothetical protein
MKTVDALSGVQKFAVGDYVLISRVQGGRTGRVVIIGISQWKSSGPVLVVHF